MSKAVPKQKQALAAKEKSRARKKGGFLRRLNGSMPVILSFFIPFFVMLLVFIQRGIYPFGERSFLRTDLYHQYAPFFKELLNKLQNGESLLYSWDIGAGSNFLALYCYYLASPVNWLLIFCPEEYVIEFITYMIVIKISASGATMAYYLKKHTGKNDYSLTMFASFYALSGFMAAYSWNIMWLDCIVLFPLVILGLENLLKKDKCILYCVTLAMTILTNYYIAIMVCIFLVLYFVAQMIIAPTSTEETLYDEEKKTSFVRVRYMNYPKKFLEFVIYSLISGGISAVLLLPAYYALQMSASANSVFPQSFSSYFSILAMLNRHLDNVEVHLGLEHWPNIFCGVAVFIFVPLYVLNKKVSVKEKVAYFVLVLFMLASFSMNFLNFIWHGFHYPNSLPCRQSFAYVFIILTMAYKGFLGLKDRTTAQITKCIVLAMGFILLCEALYAEDGEWNFTIYYVSIIFVGVYGLLAYLRNKYKSGAAFLAVIALLVVFAENFMNTTITSVTTISRTDYVKYDDSYSELEEYADSISDSVFYRSEKLKLRTKNDGSWYQYSSMSVFSSTANASLSDYYKTLGMEAATNAYSKTGATLVVDMLFSVKYEYSNVLYEDNSLRKLVKTSGDVKLYENTCALPLGFMVPADMEDNWYTTTGVANPIETQNNFISAATGIYNTFKYVDVPSDSASTTATYTVLEDGYYYAYISNSSIDEATTTITSGSGGSTQTTTHSNLKRRFVLDIGYAKEGDTITITSKTDDQDLYFNLYVLQDDVLISAYEKLNAHGLKISEMSDTEITGTITADEDGLMYTSIAYEDGWTVYVDGVETETIDFKDAMLAVPISAGSHTIHMVYNPSGFEDGTLLSVLSLILLLLVSMFRLLFAGKNIPSPFVEDIYPEPEGGTAPAVSGSLAASGDPPESAKLPAADESESAEPPDEPDTADNPDEPEPNPDEHETEPNLDEHETEPEPDSSDDASNKNNPGENPGAKFFEYGER